jgi:hypothetical protein
MANRLGSVISISSSENKSISGVISAAGDRRISNRQRQQAVIALAAASAAGRGAAAKGSGAGVAAHGVVKNGQRRNGSNHRNGNRK